MADCTPSGSSPTSWASRAALLRVAAAYGDRAGALRSSPAAAVLLLGMGSSALRGR